ncbi:MAG: UDP-2,3-diacylglucosamine diphosphatase [Gammaproteobacteria bacterium]|nr:UDP-2,3-diacylglucosamine diphosphatase [Gammaproteobacteria bacterium]NND37188.1 UDP-2,3-diacylglucosamine diphosphatase [Gammaproteobacteria bacterium]
MTTLFVSDLHLDAARPEVTDCFVRFLDDTTGKADALYILGDLFEVWFGDDDPEPSHGVVAAALRRFARAGAPIYLARGNRDFLIGQRYARESGLQLLDEQTTIEIGGDRMLLLHGDELCTDDPSYQRFRRIVRNRAIGRLFLLLPLSLRRRIADWLRKSSKATIKPDAITDVNATAVATTMRDAGVRIMVHGHTHRPAIHQMQLDGEPALRIVLGDWYTQGSVLRWTEHGPELKTLSVNQA